MLLHIQWMDNFLHLQGNLKLYQQLRYFEIHLKKKSISVIEPPATTILEVSLALEQSAKLNLLNNKKEKKITNLIIVFVIHSNF